MTVSETSYHTLLHSLQLVDFNYNCEFKYYLSQTFSFFVRESLRSFLLNNDIYSFRKKRALSSSHWTGGSTRNTPARRGIVLIQDLTD